MDLSSPQPGVTTEDLQQAAFQPLQHDAFIGLQHAPSLKGFLKPFKGKGDMEKLAQHCRSLEDDLNALAQAGIHAQASRYPFTLLPVRMTLQRTGAGTVFLRWQDVGTRQMGVDIWSRLLTAAKTPDYLIQDLHAMELQRIALNMQISLVHTIGRQAAECAEKMAQADAMYMDRLDQHTKSRGDAPQSSKEPRE
jgi:hypothetical protein